MVMGASTFLIGRPRVRRDALVWPAEFLVFVLYLHAPPCRTLSRHILHPALSFLMPAPVKRKRDIGDDLVLCGAQLAVSSAGERESKRLRATLTLDADGDESVAPFYFEVANTETVFNIALCILAAARQHSAECQCNTSRGPYNQIPRCKTYFSTALQWPDRWFRHTFRYVSSSPL